MNDTFVTLAASATIAVGLAVFVRRRGWSMAIPLIAVGAVVGWLPIGPSAPPDPEIILVAILAPLVFGEALGSSYLDLRKVSRPVLALAIGLVVATTVVIGAVGFLLVAMPIAMAMALGAVLAPDRRGRREHGRPAGRAAAAAGVDPRGREPRQRRHRPHRAQGGARRGGRGVGHAARGDGRLRRRGHGRRGRGRRRRLAADAGAAPQQRPGRRRTRSCSSRRSCSTPSPRRSTARASSRWWWPAWSSRMRSTPTRVTPAGCRARSCGGTSPSCCRPSRSSWSAWRSPRCCGAWMPTAGRDVALLVPVVIVALILTRVAVRARAWSGFGRATRRRGGSGRALLRSSAIVAWAGARGPGVGTGGVLHPHRVRAGRAGPVPRRHPGDGVLHHRHHAAAVAHPRSARARHRRPEGRRHRAHPPGSMRSWPAPRSSA